MNSKKNTALAALAAGRTIAEAAAAAGVVEKTIYNWLADDVFKAALDAIQAVQVDVILTRLFGIQSLSLDAIEAVLTDPAAGAGARLRAASLALDNVLKLYELRNIERRLAKLEETLTNESAS